MHQPPGTIDLTDQKFGRLTVLGYAGSSDKGSMWRCLCTCGQQAVVRRDRLVKGATRSCGCARQQSRAVLVDGVSSHAHPLYRTWAMMRSRCLNPDHPRYADYGGRGIIVDPRWGSFSQFVADVGPRPQGTTLDRKDNNGPYSPENCRWATPLEQKVSARGPRGVVLCGQRMALKQAAEKLGVSPTQIRQLTYMSQQQVVDLLSYRLNR